MLPLIYTNTIYTVLFLLTFVTWSASEILGPVRWSNQRRGEKRDHGSVFVSLVCGLLGITLSFLFPLLLPEAQIPQQHLAFFAGFAIVVSGVIWRWYAIQTLGPYFTATLLMQEGQPVVNHGPYKFIRHPSYSGVILIVFGFGLMIGNWISLFIITGGLVAGLIYRIPMEERELLQHLGQPYKDYMAKTKRLIPFLF